MVWLLGPLKPTFFLHFVLVSSESQRKSSAVVIKSKDKPGTAFSFIEQLQFNACFKLCECILLYVTVWICLFFCLQTCWRRRSRAPCCPSAPPWTISPKRICCRTASLWPQSNTARVRERSCTAGEKFVFSDLFSLFLCSWLKKKKQQNFCGKLSENTS